jgi:hypothetical protein
VPWPLAAERGVVNAHFEVDDDYGLPFADASFDAVLSPAMVSHLAEPMRAFAEMRRWASAGRCVGGVRGRHWHVRRLAAVQRWSALWPMRY